VRYPQIGARVTPDLLFIAAQVTVPGSSRLRLFPIPGRTDACRQVGEVLRARGARVSFERGSVVVLAAFLGGVLLQRALVGVATVCVAGAIANLGLAALERGGSWGLGVALLGAAFVALTAAVVLRRLFVPAAKLS
jgi:hypothetical protein